MSATLLCSSDDSKTTDNVQNVVNTSNRKKRRVKYRQQKRRQLALDRTAFYDPLASWTSDHWAGYRPFYRNSKFLPTLEAVKLLKPVPGAKPAPAPPSATASRPYASKPTTERPRRRLNLPDPRWKSN